MLVSDVDLRAELRSGGLTITPHDPDLVQPSSIDVRLDRLFRVYDTHTLTHIDPERPQEPHTTLIRADPEGFLLHPGKFALGSTLEKIGLGAHLAARLEGKSSLGRLGLINHSTAGFIDPGWHGHITLELSNVNELPILLRPGMKIGQICVFRLTCPAQDPYASHPRLRSRYQGQRGPTASRSWEDTVSTTAA